jgi:hypothetical protein
MTLWLPSRRLRRSGLGLLFAFLPCFRPFRREEFFFFFVGPRQDDDARRKTLFLALLFTFLDV